MIPRLAAALLLALLLAVFVVACDDSDGDNGDTGSDEPEISITLSPSDSPSPTPAPTEPLTFRDFAGELNEMISVPSSAIFLENPILTELQCPNELIDCGVPGPTVIQGIVVGNWRSEGGPVSPDEFESRLDKYLATGPTLQATAVKSEGSGGTPDYYAVTAVEGDPESVAYFIFKEDEGQFRLHSMIFAPVLGDEWLSGTCTECYDEWEAWE